MLSTLWFSVYILQFIYLVLENDSLSRKEPGDEKSK